MKNFGLLLLRLALGGLVAGHGAQKLFGWFGGPGIEGTTGMMESMGLRPGRQWALLAGLSEFGGGLLTMLGLLNPLGSLGIVSSMGMATAKVHWGKPIWVTSGGAEYPITNSAAALAVALTGPGKWSLDNLLSWHLGRRIVLIPGLILAAVGVAAGVIISTRPQPQPEEQEQAQPGVQAEQPTQEQTQLAHEEETITEWRPGEEFTQPPV